MKRKTLQGRFVKTIVFSAVISAALIILSTMLLLFAFTLRSPDSSRKIAETIKAMLQHEEGHMVNPGILYIMIWTLSSCLLTALTSVVMTAILSRRVIAPLKDLNRAAENIVQGNLNFEMLYGSDQELYDLAEAFEKVRRMLKANAEQDLRVQEERNMLVANLSHDMRTPITTIKGYLEGIADGVADTPEKMERYLHTIYAKTQVLEQLVDNMTEYSELELGRMQYSLEYVDITSYLRDLSEEYQTDVQSNGMSFETHLLSQPLTIVADRGKLKRVLDNLISNAMKYGVPGGRITLTDETDGKSVLLCVSDTGQGIQTKDLYNVFDGFYRGDPSRTSSIKGSGLGLAISRQIVENHHGKIWIKSKENVGTDVYICLPLRGETYSENSGH